MAVVDVKSQSLTNRDAVPPVRNEARLIGGRLRSVAETVSIAAGDDDGSVYRIAEVRSGWTVRSIRLLNQAITGGTAFEVGLYRTPRDGGAVVDADAYASTVDLSSGSTTGTEVAFEARPVTAVQNKVWQDAGLSADPQLAYDLCLTGTTVGTGAGTVAVEILYTAE